jgi:hypothetical protein
LLFLIVWPPWLNLSCRASVNYLTSCSNQLFHAQKYAARRGAAYGLAGVIAGTGILGMKTFNVVDRLRSAAEDKTRYESRQGAMFAFETLSSTLGRLFEPYITHILPVLFAGFGDAAGEVRDATQDTARVIMGNMSGYGVKIMLRICCQDWMRSNGVQRKDQ